MKEKLHKRLVLLEFKKSGQGLTRFTSKKPITCEQVYKHLCEVEDFNDTQDSFSFIDEPDEIELKFS